jgi:hypothetical protein
MREAGQRLVGIDREKLACGAGGEGRPDVCRGCVG